MYKKQKTFTLIEMLIVVIIIGILAAALIPRLQAVQGRARDTKRKADLRQIATAMEIYKKDNSNYNTLHQHTWCTDCWVITDTTHLAGYASVLSGSTPLDYINTMLLRYMTTVPLDPNGNDPRVSNTETNTTSQNLYGYLLAIMPRHAGTSPSVTYDSIVLAARTEADGNSSNWVTTSSSNLNIDGDYVTGSSQHWIGAVGGYDLGTRSNHPGFIAQNYDDYICSKVTLTGGDVGNDGTGSCDANLNDNNLRYIYVE